MKERLYIQLARGCGKNETAKRILIERLKEADYLINCQIIEPPKLLIGVDWSNTLDRDNIMAHVDGLIHESNYIMPISTTQVGVVKLPEEKPIDYWTEIKKDILRDSYCDNLEKELMHQIKEQIYCEMACGTLDPKDYEKRFEELLAISANYYSNLIRRNCNE